MKPPQREGDGRFFLLYTHYSFAVPVGGIIPVLRLDSWVGCLPGSQLRAPKLNKNKLDKSHQKSMLLTQKPTRLFVIVYQRFPTSNTPKVCLAGRERPS